MKNRSRNLDVIHSGMVLLSDEKGRGRPAKLVLTKEQLSIQVHAGSGDDASSISGLAEASETTLSNKPRTVNISKTKDGLGLSIKGGNDGTTAVPIVISKVLPNFPAAQTGQIFVGDAIVEINGVGTENKSHEDVVNMLREAPDPNVTLTLRHNSQMAPLLRSNSMKRLSGSVNDSIIEVNMFKIQSALKTATERAREAASMKEDDLTSTQWKTINKLPLPMAIVSRYLWSTDKLRNNAFEVRSVDGRSSGVIHCEDRGALDLWIKFIDNHIAALNKKSIKMSNKFLHPSEHISYIGWVEERMPPNYFDDPKLRWEQRFIILKGSDLCVFETPPLNSEELDKCVCLYKIYETALKTAVKRRDRREHIFCLDTYLGQSHYFSLHGSTQLQQFETAYYNCVYKSVTTMQARTFACSYDGRPAGFVLDIKAGFSMYDIPTKKYIWQYGFEELESSSDDGKMRLQLVYKLQTPNPFSALDVKEIECDQILAVVFTMHAFYVTKIMGADPEHLKATPLS
ncbi:Gamma-1-syntrophin [Aphelenchoides besseyi]|nr:Gamma-1-syntrophin [Aphelenchoides besseyi]KAI6210197.1 Gamma-1-syntrophin [Aphelenchoides besseyi]